MITKEACLQCGLRQYKRNGHLRTGKPNHEGQEGGRAFVLTPRNGIITEEQRALIERLVLERIARRGLCRALGAGLHWLLHIYNTAGEFVKECDSYVIHCRVKAFLL